MSLLPLSSLALSAALSLALPASASAQSAPAPGSRVLPVFATQPLLTRAPPRPAGLGGNLPPGSGGPNPSLVRGHGGGASAARREAAGLLAVCGPGGVLSAQGAAGNPGRSRARALVCPD
jgi:hypothetical protein